MVLFLLLLHLRHSDIFWSHFIRIWMCFYVIFQFPFSKVCLIQSISSDTEFINLDIRYKTWKAEKVKNCWTLVFTMTFWLTRISWNGQCWSLLGPALAVSRQKKSDNRIMVHLKSTYKFELKALTSPQLYLNLLDRGVHFQMSGAHFICASSLK